MTRKVTSTPRTGKHHSYCPHHPHTTHHPHIITHPHITPDLTHLTSHHHISHNTYHRNTVHSREWNPSTCNDETLTWLLWCVHWASYPDSFLMAKYGAWQHADLDWAMKNSGSTYKPSMLKHCTHRSRGMKARSRLWAVSPLFGG